MNTRFLALIISILLVVGVAAPAESQLTAYYSKYDTISARSDSNTVIVWDGSDVLDFVTGGSLALSISASQVVTYSGALTVGVDDTGYDVTFYGASAGAYFLWDESADLLDLRGKTAEGAGTLRLTTGETTVVDGNVLGRVDFLAPLEASGTDAILVAASIIAEADDTFGAALNDADLVFALAESETAAERIRFSYDGSATAITTGAATTISTGGNNAMTLTSGTAAHTITAGDLTLYDDNNNADVSVKLGTSATEALTIQVLNGAANKSAESVNIVSSTAAGGANAGQITIGVDDATILTIDDSGINAVLGATTPAAATVTTLTASSGGSLTGTWTDLGTITTADINGGTVDGVTIGASSAPTVTDLGSVATADINGGTLDGVTIGGASAAAATVTTFTSTGIDDNATGEILQITDSGATVAGDFSATDLDGILGSNAPAAANVTTLSATGATSFLGAAGSIVHTVGQNGGGSTNQYYQMISEQYDAAETEGFQIMETFSNGTNNQIVIGGGSADYNAANLIYFYTGANDATRTGTSRMVIDGSGDVGIGTASPDGPLHIYVADATVTAATAADDLIIENATGGASSVGMTIVGSTNDNCNIYMGDSGSNYRGAIVYSNSADALSLVSAAATGLTLDSNSNVGIGLSGIQAWESSYTGVQVGGAASLISTTAEADGGLTAIGHNYYLDSGGLKHILNDECARMYFLNGETVFQTATAAAADAAVSFTSTMVLDALGRMTHTTATTGNSGYYQLNNGADPYGIFLSFAAAAPDDNTNYFLMGADTGATRVKIYSDGDLQNHDNSYGAISDRKVKQDITDAPSLWEKWKQLRFRNFRLKEDVARGKDELHHGLVAQEVEPIMPKLVYSTPDFEKVTVQDTSYAPRDSIVVSVDTVSVPQDSVLVDSVLVAQPDLLSFVENKVARPDTMIVQEREIQVATGDSTKALTYSHLYVKGMQVLQDAVNAIDYLNAENTALKARVTTLEAKVAALEGGR